MKKTLRFVALAVLIGGGCAFAYVCWVSGDVPVRAQETKHAVPSRIPDDSFEPRPEPPPGVIMSQPVPDGAVPMRRRLVPVLEVDDPRRTEMHAFHEATEKLRSAKDDAGKEAAKKELTQLLDQSFTRDLEQREHEVSEIESRVKKLRDQIEKRKKAKEEIISLRLKTIVNEVDGLGFPGPMGFERETGPESPWGRFTGPFRQHPGNRKGPAFYQPGPQIAPPAAPVSE